MCDICPHPCGEGKGDCCTAYGSAGCDDPSCCDIVCGVNSGCCMNNWTQTCANLAAQHCEPCIPPIVCGSPGTGHCCEANGSPLCDVETCCTTVCDIDSYCCEQQWDECCAHLAHEHCAHSEWPEQSICELPPPPPECGGESGDCCISNGSPGCAVDWCCQAVCDADSFCCEVTWDSICADAAETTCGNVCFGPPAFPPIAPAFSCEHNCGGAALSGCWCDEACCSFGDCCEDKGEHCPGCLFGFGPAKFFGDWCVDDGCGGTSFGGCGCDEACFEFGDCCSLICWDCPDLQGCALPNPADLTGNGVVDVFDLLELLANWGECEYDRCFVMGPTCAGDFNHDHQVDVFDLLFLLKNWG